MARRIPSPTLSQMLEDFPLYAEHNLKIKTKDAKLIPFKLNRAQRALWNRINQKLLANEPVRIFVLKARQLGFSTFAQALLYWSTSLRPYRNGLVVSHEDKSSNTLFNKSEVFYRYSQDALRPMTRQANRNEMYFANPNIKAATKNPGLESRIIVQTANNKNLGASHTLHFVHMSEMARYEQLLQDVRASIITLLQTVAYEPWTFVLVETTAQGAGFAKTWWDDPDDDFLKFFASWVSSDEYTADVPLASDQLSNDPLGKWGDEHDVIGIIADELRKWYPQESEDFDWLKREALKRMAWRRRTIKRQCRGDLEFFRQEYPLTPEEAFITSGSQVFSLRTLASMKHALLDENRQPKYPPTTYAYRQTERGFQKAPEGLSELKVWEEPRPGLTYVIGADVGEGLDGMDYSAAHILRLPDMAQVAVYHGRSKPDQFAHALYDLGKMYNWAWVGVENNGPGIATNLLLRDALFYSKLYTREAFDAGARKITDKVGWSTNRASKPIMITDLRAYIDDSILILKDLETIEELLNYTTDKAGKMGAPPGQFDDLVMALAIALQVAKRYSAHGQPERTPIQMEGTVEWWFAQADKMGRDDNPLDTVGFPMPPASPSYDRGWM